MLSAGIKKIMFIQFVRFVGGDYTLKSIYWICEVNNKRVDFDDWHVFRLIACLINIRKNVTNRKFS